MDTLVLPTPDGNISDTSQLEIITHPRPHNPHRDVRTRTWFLTWNNAPVDSAHTLLGLHAAKYCFQKEKGENGVVHWQGVFLFKNAKKWSALNNKLDPHGYWAPCRNLAAAHNYCKKMETAIRGTLHEHGFAKVDKVRDPLRGKTLYVWQQEIIDMCFGVADERTIYWYWSSVGNTGKTALCKHMCLKMDAIVVGGKAKDAFYAIGERKKAGKTAEIVLFNIPRSSKNHISYPALEGIKDGLFFSAKYESGNVLTNPPHVIVFANSAPDLAMLSEDRWKVVNVDPRPDVDLAYHAGAHEMFDGYDSPQLDE